MKQITLSTGRLVRWGFIKKDGRLEIDIHYDFAKSVPTEEEKIEAVNLVNTAIHGPGEKS